MVKKTFRLVSVVNGEGIVIDTDIVDDNISLDNIRIYNVLNGFVGARAEFSDFIKVYLYTRMIEIYSDMENIQQNQNNETEENNV